MSENAAFVRYILLKGIHACIRGHIRLNSSTCGTELTLHTEGCRSEWPLRLLLISCGEEGAVLDLGAIAAPADGVSREVRSLPPLILRHWDAVVLAEDWPSGKVAAVGWMAEQAGALWRLQEAASRYLAVPPAGCAPLRDVVMS